MKKYLLAALVLSAACSRVNLQPVQVVQNKDFHQTKSILFENKGKKAKNIIFLIGDGMGLTQVYAGMSANKGSLFLENCQVIGLSKTYSSDNYITDSAAGATAFSMGQKTFNGAIGVDKDKKPQKTILELAEEKGLATGLVATCAITHATPASFIAHQPSRTMMEEIAADFLKTDVDVFIGGGKTYFEKNKGKNLLDELKAKNYQVADGIEQIGQVKSGKLAGFLAEKHQKGIHEGRSKDELLLSTRKALELLQQNNEKGFFLMVEGSQIDWGGHNNNANYVVAEMLDFDRTIGEVLEFAAKDGETLVVITADHETGGLTLNGGSIAEGKVEAKFTTNYHTAVMVPVFAFGADAQKFMGFYENTQIFHKFKEILGL